MPFGGGKKDNVELLSIRMRPRLDSVLDDISSTDNVRQPPKSMPNQFNQASNSFCDKAVTYDSKLNDREEVNKAKRVIIHHDPHNRSEPENHHVSEARLVEVRKSLSGRCGFRLTRTVHDPYPWVRILFWDSKSLDCLPFCLPMILKGLLFSNCR